MPRRRGRGRKYGPKKMTTRSVRKNATAIGSNNSQPTATRRLRSHNTRSEENQAKNVQMIEQGTPTVEQIVQPENAEAVNNENNEQEQSENREVRSEEAAPRVINSPSEEDLFFEETVSINVEYGDQYNDQDLENRDVRSEELRTEESEEYDDAYPEIWNFHNESNSPLAHQMHRERVDNEPVGAVIRIDDSLLISRQGLVGLSPGDLYTIERYLAGRDNFVNQNDHSHGNHSHRGFPIRYSFDQVQQNHRNEFIQPNQIFGPPLAWPRFGSTNAAGSQNIFGLRSGLFPRNQVSQVNLCYHITRGEQQDSAREYQGTEDIEAFAAYLADVLEQIPRHRVQTVQDNILNDLMALFPELPLWDQRPVWGHGTHMETE